MVSGDKIPDPRRTRAAQIANRARWGQRRHVDLRKLDPDTARLIRALVANAEAEPVEADDKGEAAA